MPLLTSILITVNSLGSRLATFILVPGPLNSKIRADNLGLDPQIYYLISFSVPTGATIKQVSLGHSCNLVPLWLLMFSVASFKVIFLNPSSVIRPYPVVLHIVFYQGGMLCSLQLGLECLWGKYLFSVFSTSRYARCSRFLALTV